MSGHDNNFLKVIASLRSMSLKDMVDYLKYIGAGALTLGALTTATSYLLGSAKPMEQLSDLASQTQEIPGRDRARISRICRDGKLINILEEDTQTLYEAYLRGCRLSDNGPSLGWKPSPQEPYKWMTFNDALLRASNLGGGFIQKGLKPLNNTHIGIYSQNRPEFMITEMACYTYSMVIVPLYDTLGPEACTFIINQAEISIVVCDKLTRVRNLLDKKSELPDLRCIVVMEAASVDIEAEATQLGVEIITIQAMEQLGKDNPKEPNLCKPDDNCLICYTSGTTGMPKGAMLTHRGALATAVACHLQLPHMNIGPDDIIVSYLPLAHSYERLTEVYVYMNGGKIGYFQGDVKRLTEDIKELQPTLFPTVPRLLNRIYDKVNSQVEASMIKKFIFNIGLREKEKELHKGIVRNNSIWDKIAFGKVQATLGGKLKLITTGSAPLSPKILNWIRCVVGCPVIEGYGQTECHAICTLQMAGDSSIGQVGPPLCCNIMKLVDVPEMEYYASDNKGEICVKGVNVFRGYLKDPEKTREVLDDEGWLHTGDIGQWCENGSMKVIDRKKNMFKLSQGEYIAPEKIENIYIRSPLISQIYIHGNSLKASLVAITTPDPDVIPGWAKSNLGLSGTLAELSTSPALKKAMLNNLTEIGRKAGLQSFEQVKDIYIYDDQFSVENGLLTPTMKAKRQELQKYFSRQIDDMYSRLA